MPTSKIYNKNHLSLDLQHFIRLIKLRAHLKDENSITTAN